MRTLRLTIVRGRLKRMAWSPRYSGAALLACAGVVALTTGIPAGFGWALIVFAAGALATGSPAPTDRGRRARRS